MKSNRAAPRLQGFKLVHAGATSSRTLTFSYVFAPSQPPHTVCTLFLSIAAFCNFRGPTVQDSRLANRSVIPFWWASETLLDARLAMSLRKDTMAHVMMSTVERVGKVQMQCPLMHTRGNATAWINTTRGEA
jgi:hypothetical protein